jgi:hypothetical protein
MEMNMTQQAMIDTSYRAEAPRLTSRNLTILLGLMCLTPVVIIALVFWQLPSVKMNQLQASVEILGGPPDSYYRLPFQDRTYLPELQIAVTNTSQETWTNLYVRINHDYSVFETGVPFQPGETREYLVNRFTSKQGAFYDMRYNPIREVMIYARVPDGSRATHFAHFE